MCMITYIPAGVDIPTEGIACSARVNDDGHGYMLASRENGLQFFRSMDFAETMGELQSVRRIDEPVVFHSRYATHGTTNLYNVHPFYLGDESYEQTGMVHNGVLPRQFQPAVQDARSDTRILASMLGSVPRNAHGIPSRRQARYLARVIGSGNKLVFMSMKTGAPKVRIVNQEAGVWTDGVWFSNTGFKRYRYLNRDGGTYSGGWTRAGSTSSTQRGTVRTIGEAASEGSETWRKYWEERAFSTASGSREADSTEESSTSSETPAETPSTDRQQQDAEERFTHWLHGAEADDDTDFADLSMEQRQYLGYTDCGKCFNTATVDVASNFCLACNWCHDCSETIQDCSCYTPTASRALITTGGEPPF